VTGLTSKLIIPEYNAMKPKLNPNASLPKKGSSRLQVAYLIDELPTKGERQSLTSTAPKTLGKRSFQEHISTEDSLSNPDAEKAPNKVEDQGDKIQEVQYETRRETDVVAHAVAPPPMSMHAY